MKSTRGGYPPSGVESSLLSLERQPCFTSLFRLLRHPHGHHHSTPGPPRKPKATYGNGTGQVDPMQPIRPWITGEIGLLAAMKLATSPSMKLRVTIRSVTTG